MNATETKGSLLQERFPEMVAVMVAGGFALTLGELLLMNHTEKSQNIGVVLTGIGMVAVALGVMVGPRLRKVLAGLLIVVAAGGLFGVYEHLEEAQEHREKAERARQESGLVVQKADYDAHEGEEASEHREGKKEEKHGPPPLAPLSVSGLALMGSLGLIASKR